MDPNEALQGLIDACEKKQKIHTIGEVEQNARRDFGLSNKTQIYSFIWNNGLEKPQYIGKSQWKNNPNRATEETVYEFNFYSGLKFGYIAFVKIETTGFWIIKSFKKNTKPNPMSFPLEKGLLEWKAHIEGKK